MFLRKLSAGIGALMLLTIASSQPAEAAGLGTTATAAPTLAAWLHAGRPDVAAALGSGRWFDVLGQYLKEAQSWFLARPDVAAARAAHQPWSEIEGEWIREQSPAFW